MDQVSCVGTMIEGLIKQYIQTLRENRIAISQLYLFGSHARGRAEEESDIDLAVFWDRDEIDGFDEDVLLLRLTRDVDLRIEPHSFSRKDLENPNPFVREILATGERIL
ncbi:nucleotidyltransferase domain-containing protein [Desulfatirhabdium butyrativorans]|uniref:nucleotidyltransferase domain-containing protein n=1 Tax=Desulfatirhabdium butyrativorans TaxID=340467 RepID=UPI00041286D5|nr:nucleotidyltransferase domain-containing protein [Desulfatirhabdium butyrativorans]